MIGLGYALTAQAWEVSRARETLLRLGNGALNTVLGTAAAVGLLSVGLACALPRPR
ncbi:MAG: hypothetical protein AB7N76_25490 [Planctomycetota bacterium]